MGKKKESGGAVAGEAARLTCAWLARHGLELWEETMASGPERERNCGMEIRRSPGKSVRMDKMFPTWDWAGSHRTLDEAWLEVVNWLFGLDGEGPSWVQETSSYAVSPGWSRLRKRRFAVPKLAFSSLAEFVLKASVHPDFPSPDGEKEAS